MVFAIFIMLVGFYPLSDLLGTTLYQDIFSRRLFFTPARLDFLYYDFFVSREPLLFSNSFMSGFINYPFDKAYPYIIGDFSKMGGPDTAANNGFLATGYMHLGWLGVVLYPTIVAILVVLVDWLAAEKSKAVVAAVCFYPFAALFTSSDLPTAILTHGIGLLLLILWLDGSRAEVESGQG